MQLHIDFSISSRDELERHKERVLPLGATVLLKRTDGTVLTGTAPAALNPSVEVCHELGPYCEAFRLAQPVVASVCLHEPSTVTTGCSARLECAENGSLCTLRMFWSPYLSRPWSTRCTGSHFAKPSLTSGGLRSPTNCTVADLIHVAEEQCHPTRDLPTPPSPSRWPIGSRQTRDLIGVRPGSQGVTMVLR